MPGSFRHELVIFIFISRLPPPPWQIYFVYIIRSGLLACLLDNPSCHQIALMCHHSQTDRQQRQAVMLLCEFQLGPPPPTRLSAHILRLSRAVCPRLLQNEMKSLMRSESMRHNLSRSNSNSNKQRHQWHTIKIIRRIIFVDSPLSSSWTLVGFQFDY